MRETLFHYQVSGRAGSRRPGAHAGRSAGAGHEFMSHARLFDHPDPRRLDLRASLRSGGEEWLVRTYRQRAALALHAIVDMSPSMTCSQPDKLALAAAFVASMGESAFKNGDAAGMCAFDHAARQDLYQPALYSRTGGEAMAQRLRNAPAAHGAGCGVLQAVQPLVGRQALVFLVSDFHWPLALMGAALDLLAHAWVVPVVLQDHTDRDTPQINTFLRLRDAENGTLRSLWMTPRLRRQWQEHRALRRSQFDALLASRHLRALYLDEAYDATTVSHYFMAGLRA